MTDSIPDHWPDEGTTGAVEDGVAPMFPLPGVFLFPGQLMPLHVLEPHVTGEQLYHPPWFFPGPPQGDL